MKKSHTENILRRQSVSTEQLLIYNSCTPALLLQRLIQIPDMFSREMQQNTIIFKHMDK